MLVHRDDLLSIMIHTKRTNGNVTWICIHRYVPDRGDKKTNSGSDCSW